MIYIQQKYSQSKCIHHFQTKKEPRILIILAPITLSWIPLYSVCLTFFFTVNIFIFPSLFLLTSTSMSFERNCLTMTINSFSSVDNSVISSVNNFTYTFLLYQSFQVCSIRLVVNQTFNALSILLFMNILHINCFCSFTMHCYTLILYLIYYK